MHFLEMGADLGEAAAGTENCDCSIASAYTWTDHGAHGFEQYFYIGTFLYIVFYCSSLIS